MEEIIISSFMEYMKFVNIINTNCSVDDSKKDIIYRGISDYTHKLLPGIFRHNCDSEDAYSEDAILEHFAKEARCYEKNLGIKDSKAWLELAQHYGVPTRLLDFTFNPLVALYFCCCDEQNIDGSIYFCNLHNYKEFRQKNIEYMTKYSKYTTNEFINEILQKMVTNEKYTPYPVRYVPYYFEQRMSAQSSVFLIWGSDLRKFDDILGERYYRKKDLKVIACGDVFDNLDKKVYGKFKISRYCKKDMIKYLDTLGINEKTLFPGLDGVGKYIARHYKI